MNPKVLQTLQLVVSCYEIAVDDFYSSLISVFTLLPLSDNLKYLHIYFDFKTDQSITIAANLSLERATGDRFHLGIFESNGKYLITELKKPEDPLRWILRRVFFVLEDSSKRRKLGAYARTGEVKRKDKKKRGGGATNSFWRTTEA